MTGAGQKLIGYRCMKSPEGVIPLASYCDPCPDDVPVYEECPTCKGLGRVACLGPKNGCYGMHMGHPCPECNTVEGGGPHEHDLSATALSDDATPAASADVGPDRAASA